MNARATLGVLTAVQATRTQDGLVHLRLRDGTVVVGRLFGCTGSAVFLHDQPSVPTELLRD